MHFLAVRSALLQVFKAGGKKKKAVNPDDPSRIKKVPRDALRIGFCKAVVEMFKSIDLFHL